MTTPSRRPFRHVSTGKMAMTDHSFEARRLEKVKRPRQSCIKRGRDLVCCHQGSVRLSCLLSQPRSTKTGQGALCVKYPDVLPRSSSLTRPAWREITKMSERSASKRAVSPICPCCCNVSERAHVRLAFTLGWHHYHGGVHVFGNISHHLADAARICRVGWHRDSHGAASPVKQRGECFGHVPHGVLSLRLRKRSLVSAAVKGMNKTREDHAPSHARVRCP